MATVEIDGEALDEIIVEEMLTSIMYLKRDVKKIKKTNHGYIFSKDPKIDLLKITALIDAYVLILEHYGVNVEET
jgi:hypothetical protein